MKKRISFCFVAAFASIFGLAACGGGDEEQQEAQQKQQGAQQEQQATQQQETQQEPTRQAAQTTPSTTQSSDLAAAQLIGTYEATSAQGEPLPPGTLVLTFSDDGALRLIAGGGQNASVTGQYSVLDDSRIQVTTPDGVSSVWNYSLDGDTLTLTVQGVTTTYQRTG